MISAMVVSLVTPAVAKDRPERLDPPYGYDAAASDAATTDAPVSLARAAPTNPDRQMYEVAAGETGFNALVNTLGLRSTKPEFAGEYVTIASDRRKLKAGVANQHYTELGVFRDGNNRFKLLGVDGRWVKLRWNDAGDKRIAGTWSKKWDKAWSFKVVRPNRSAIPAGVESKLLGLDIDPRHPICVRAYNPNGKYRGLLGLTKAGTMVLKPDALCGKSTAALFITDTVPSSVGRKKVPAHVADGLEVDKFTYTKYVAPDLPALTLNETRRELMRQDIEDYFNTLRAFNDGVRSDVADVNTNVTFALLTESYEIPGEKAEDVNLLDFFVDQTSTLLGFIPVVGDVASAALSIIYDSVTLGIAMVHNQNLEGPRVVEGVTNDVLRTRNKIARRYKKTFSDIGQNIDAMKVALLAGCPSRRECTTDRTLAAWWDADPNADLPANHELARQHTVAAHELVIWQRLLPIRGMLYEPPGWLAKLGEWKKAAKCTPPYPYNGGYHNEHILGRYEIMAAPPNEEVWGKPLVSVHMARPYGHYYRPWSFCSWIWIPFQAGYTVGLADNDQDAVTPAPDLARLFDPWDPEQPVTSGFGIPIQEVACEWLINPARGYAGNDQPAVADYYHPCHLATYGASGEVVNPYEGEPGTKYGEAISWAAAYWLPTNTELEAGRPIADPDVCAPTLPHMEFNSCKAYKAGEVQSVVGGEKIKVHFTNLYDGAVDIYWIKPNGKLSANPAVHLERQDHMARPFSGDAYWNPLSQDLEYSAAIYTTVGRSFLAKNEAGECLGAFTAVAMPEDAAVDYQIAEIHGDKGILLKPTP